MQRVPRPARHPDPGRLRALAAPRLDVAGLHYGSGFLDGDGPLHLPSHTTFDLSLGKNFGENWTVQASGLNLNNNQYLLDNSNTFGGTHYVNPREVIVEVRYRFRY